MGEELRERAWSVVGGGVAFGPPQSSPAGASRERGGGRRARRAWPMNMGVVFPLRGVVFGPPLRYPAGEASARLRPLLLT